MITRILLAVLTLTLSVFAADDPWEKVKALKSGQELRIVRADAKQPLLAKMDEATAESLLVVVKDEQLAIPKDQILRIDARPVQKGSRVTRESKTTSSYPDRVTGPPTMPNGTPGQSVSTSSGLAIGGKPDFELVYRKVTGAPVPTR
jgi:hypothetical protein